MDSLKEEIMSEANTRPCEECNGLGKVSGPAGGGEEPMPCPRCGGTGRAPSGDLGNEIAGGHATSDDTSVG